jgi:hypothetical protein
MQIKCLLAYELLLKSNMMLSLKEAAKRLNERLGSETHEFTLSKVTDLAKSGKLPGAYQKRFGGW